jgi:hypothetical protein
MHNSSLKDISRGTITRHNPVILMVPNHNIIPTEIVTRAKKGRAGKISIKVDNPTEIIMTTATKTETTLNLNFGPTSNSRRTISPITIRRLTSSQMGFGQFWFGF